MSTCYNNCSIVLITNTGTTQSTIDFIDCSGSTVQFYIEPSDSYYINYCGDFPISGENIDIQVESLSFDIFTFEDCCNKSNVFYTFLNSDIGSGLEFDDVIYFSNIIPSDGNNDIKSGCFKVASIESDISLVTGYTQPYYSVLHIDAFYTSIFPCQNCLTTHPCPTECYSLYSCDGKFVEIKSSLSELSAYTNNFVSLDILTPEVSGNNICFFVIPIGVQSCLDTYDLKINVKPICDCDCECYQFSTTISDLETTYVDCNNNFSIVSFESNSYVKICSKIKPYFDSILPVPYKLGGYCANNNCPEIQTPTIQPLNECDVLTLFPLFVECVTELPTSKISFDGSVSLIISGGTPPYNIVWDNGSVSQSLVDLTFGSYTALVVDYYGDFSATTTCVLTAETTTTTTTTILPTPEEFPNLCFFVDYSKQTISDRYIDFSFIGYYNDKPYWQSNPPINLQIIWDNENSMWMVSGLTYGQVVTLNPSTLPLTGWQALGFLPPFNVNGIYAYTGSCSQIPITSLQVLATDPTCGCDGTITLIPIDGVPPYQYSINGGLSYNSIPIFNDLCSGLYPLQVLDVSGNTITSQISLNPGPTITTYTIKLVVDSVQETFEILISPTLPSNVTISFDLVHNRIFRRGPSQNSATFNNQLTVYQGPPITLPTPYNIDYYFYSQENLPFPCEIYDRFITESYFKWNLTMNSISTVTGGYTNSILFTSPSSCNTASGDFGIYLDQVKMNGCECCEIIVINPKFRISSSGDIIFTD
jgi:hypothetical protein